MTARYDRGRALTRPIDLQLDRGAAVALLGHNGSGKTSLMLVAAGKLRPVEGEATTLGYPSSCIPRAALVSLYEIIEPVLNYDFLSLEQYWKWHRAFYPKWSDAVACRLAEDLQAPLDRPLARLSRGQKLKARLTCAFAVQPALLILDEPFEGLDGRSRAILQAELVQWRQESRGGILYSAHREEDIAGLATARAEID